MLQTITVTVLLATSIVTTVRTEVTQNMATSHTDTHLHSQVGKGTRSISNASAAFICYEAYNYAVVKIDNLAAVSTNRE